MEVILIGIMPLDFSSTNGEHIKGSNIYVSFNDENVTGQKTEKFFLKEEIKLPEHTKINDKLELSFNHKGKITSIKKA